MSVKEDIKDSILQAIDTIAQRRIEQLRLDRTITAIIQSPVGIFAGKKIYKVLYNGGYFNAIAQNTNDAYLPNMAVYVQIPEGDFSKEKFILGRASKIASGEQQSVVSALVNNYGIIGKNNVVNLNDEIFTLRSYHNPQEEQEDPDSIVHRYNTLYKEGDNTSKLIIDNGDFLLYKKEASAIMIRANFMTKLSREQREQANGEYGLVFNFVFNNLAAGLGETQEEVFNYFAQKIYALDSEGHKTYLTSYDQAVRNLLQTSAQEDLIGTDKLLDIKLNEIQEVIRVYNERHVDEVTIEMTNTMDAYLQNLQDMVNMTTKANAVLAYEMWMAEEVGESAEKVVSYFLSSNKMMGNPFSYTSWVPQYAVFNIDLENFIRVDSVLFYKEGFIKQTSKESEDILVKDIQLYAMKPLADYNGQYQLKVEAPETGLIFDSLDDYKTIVVEATLFREFYEDLTFNDQTTIFWFKQDRRVISANADGYNMYGGLGWALIDNNRARKLQVIASEAQAYENHYRCAVLYEGEDTPIVLTDDFIIYNNGGQKFVITSDLGNSFSFDSGDPTLTIYKEESSAAGETQLVELNDNNMYRFSWSVIDQNNQKVFLQEEDNLSLSDMTINNYMTYSRHSRLLHGIDYFDGDRLIPENGDLELATRIKYPISNISTDSSVTFESYVGYSSTGQEPYLSIGKATITLTNLMNNTSISGYRLYIENGDQVFQYDEYGNAPNSGKTKDIQQVLPLTARLFTPANIEVSNTNFQVKWFFPTGESLIEYDSAQAELDPATGENNIFESYQVSFDIKKLYNYNAIDNQIFCQVTLGDKIVEKETTFYFGKVGDNGTNGTDMVAKIVPSADSPIFIEQPLSIITYLDENSNRVAFFNNQSRDSAVSELKIASSLNENNDNLIAKLYQKTEEVVPRKVRWNIAGNTSSATNKKGRDFILSEVKDANNQPIYQVSFKNFVDSKNKFRQQILKSEITYKDNEADNNNKTYYAFYSIPLIEYTDPPSRLPKNRIGINVKTYLKDVLYNADGRNPMYNHNQGLELIRLPKKCVITWEAKGGYVNNENAPNFKLLLNQNDRKDQAQLKFTNTAQSMIYVLPNDDFNGAITNNYIQATVKELNDNNQIINIVNVYAPINMTLNTFGLASLNAWDGNSITIDEEQGYIMAPQIGAGYKDSTTNLFTGAVMGQADDYSSGGEHLYTGLFGYKDGMRSFFLDAETGNAYFGYPTLESSEDKVRIYNPSTKKWEDKENYNEGIIELKPNGISQIGGWRFGRKALYYTTTKDLGNRYDKDFVPNRAGQLYLGDLYHMHHEKDIGHEDAGILLYSGENPYLSIKGAPLAEEYINTNLNSNLMEGDSLEIQLEPSTPTLFTIFRHNGRNRVNKFNPDGTKPGAPVLNSRTFLAGINSKGELIANAIASYSGGQGGEEGSVTKSTVNQLRAFKDNQGSEPSYVGALFEAGDYSIAQMFINKTLSPTSTLHITGGQNIIGNERCRPIHIHGADIALYAADSNSTNNGNAPTTDAYFSLETNLLKGYVGNSGFTFGRLSGYSSSINTAGGLTINSGLNDTTRQTFILNTGTQSINTKGDIGVVANGNIATTATGAITISNSTNQNINITRSGGSYLSLQNLYAYLKAGNVSNNNLLTISGDTGTNTELKSASTINVVSSGGRLYFKGVTPGNGTGNTETGSAITMSSGTSSLKVSDYSSLTSSYPFHFSGGPNVGEFCVIHTPRGDIQNEFYIGMYTKIAGSLAVSQTGSFQSLTTNGSISVNGGSIIVTNTGGTQTNGLELTNGSLSVAGGAAIAGQLDVNNVVASGSQGLVANNGPVTGDTINCGNDARSIHFGSTSFQTHKSHITVSDLFSVIDWLADQIGSLEDDVDYIEENYVTTSTLNATLAQYVKTDDLDSYVTERELSNELRDYVTNSDLDNYATNSDLNNYVSNSTFNWHQHNFSINVDGNYAEGTTGNPV